MYTNIYHTYTCIYILYMCVHIDRDVYLKYEVLSCMLAFIF